MLSKTPPPFTAAAREQAERPLDAQEYEQIKRLWLDHITAEHSADIAGLMATLTDDCVYTILNNGKTWHGHAGATKFYEAFLSAFPENCFEVVNCFVGPQGVVEEAHFNGVHTGDLLGLPSTGQPIEFDVVLLFPWDRQRKLFKGERIYFAIERSLIANVGQILRRIASRERESSEKT